MLADTQERLAPAEAYRLWAPTYAHETVVTALEERVVRDLLSELEGRRLLDIGCGVGRRVRAVERAPALAVGLDLVPEMLYASRKASRQLLVAGDARRLPFVEGAFDVLWCRLVLGHLEDLHVPYREMARVSRSPALLIVSDFHPAAVAAGHTRAFRDEGGVLHEIEHWVHPAARHIEMAAAYGWTLEASVDAPAGTPERPFYERAGRLDQFRAEAGLPLVLAMRFVR
jgi:malonyl-CoA O-methyltransferase